MSGFNFEKDLAHQTDAVQSIMAVFSKVAKVENHPQPAMSMLSNPSAPFNSDVEFGMTVVEIQKTNQITKPSSIPTVNKKSRVLDISMETGTGKT